MRCTRVLATCLAAGLTFATAASAQVIYGSQHSGPDGLASLFTIDPATGTATLVGPIGFERCGAIDFSPAGVLYGICERADQSGLTVLVTIDPATGAGTEVGPTGFAAEDDVSDISFRADGTLFLYHATNDPGHTLFTVDVATGTATLVGDSGFDFTSGNAMSFDSAGTLLLSNTFSDGDPDLNVLDTATGAGSLLCDLPVSPTSSKFHRFAAMDLDPATGTLWAIHKDSNGPSIDSLATIDSAGCTATLVGLTTTGMDGIAVLVGGGDDTSVLEIPTLGGASLAALALLLAAAGLVLARRHRLG